jgi:hypothetical protein
MRVMRKIRIRFRRLNWLRLKKMMMEMQKIRKKMRMKMQKKMKRMTLEK